MKNVYVWQLPLSNPRCFRPVDYIEVDVRDYVLVYETSTEETIDDNYLEELFTMLNDNEDFRLRSMSASDLIIVQDIEDQHKITGYAVDLVGFKEVEVKGYGL